MAESTQQTIARLNKEVVERQERLKAIQKVLGVRHQRCKEQARVICILIDYIEELQSEEGSNGTT